MPIDTLKIREPVLEDENQFLAAMQSSHALHAPWVVPPLTAEEFKNYIYRYRQGNQKSYLVIDDSDAIIGVFNISEIIRGPFQNAYLGFFGVNGHNAKGKMSVGLKLVLEKGFNELGLHRFEANIQPDNTPSIQLVQKNGFRKEGYSPRYLKINNTWCDHERWAITLEDWELPRVVF
jgi:RimJ/RimL family protein N-acetyltransferase